MRVFARSAPETCVNRASHGPIDVVVGWSVIFSSRARGAAPHRAFFVMWVSVDKWIRCGLLLPSQTRDHKCSLHIPSPHRGRGQGEGAHNERIAVRLTQWSVASGPYYAQAMILRSMENLITASSGSTSSAPSRERPPDAGFRHSIAGATRPAADGSTSPSWDKSLAGCSPSRDRYRSALSATRSSSEVPRSSASSNPWVSAGCHPSYWTAAPWAWTPETSSWMSCCSEVARAVCSAAETGMGTGRRAPIVAAAAPEAEAVEAGNPSGPPPSTRPRAGPSRRASRSLSSFGVGRPEVGS
jgi:hypothetical protein